MNCDIFKPKDNDTKHLKKVRADHHLTLVIAEPTRVTITKAEEINQEITDAGIYSESVNELIIKIDDTIRKIDPSHKLGKVQM